MAKMKLLLCCLLSLLWSGGSCCWPKFGLEVERREDVLYNLLVQVNVEEPIVLLLLLQRRQPTNLDALQHWPFSNWPVLRYDERYVIRVINYTRKALALIYIREIRDALLLTAALAESLEGMREARIIIWLQIEKSNAQELLDLIGRQARRYYYYNILILIGEGRRFSLLRMQPFPQPSYEELRLPLNRTLNNTERLFVQHWRNFRGKRAVMIPSLVPPNSFISRDPRTGREYFNGFCYNLMESFAKHRNIQLEYLSPFLNETRRAQHRPEIMLLIGRGEVDFITNVQPFSQRHQAEGTQRSATLGMVSFLIVVPCGHELSIRQIYLRMFSPKSMLKLLAVYVGLSLFETFVAYCCRKSKLNFPYSRFVLNLNVLRNLINHTVPIARRSRLPVRILGFQLALLGIMCNISFNATLSTWLTKQPRERHIQNYAELNASRLPVLFDYASYELIETEYEADFFTKKVPNAVCMEAKDQVELLLSLNTSYAYLTYSLIWNALEVYQQNYKYPLLCKSNDIHIAEEFPVNTILQKNSIYAAALDDYIMNAQNVGLTKLFKLRSYHDMMIGKVPSVACDSVKSPIYTRFDDLQLFWKLYLLGHVMGLLIFIVELSVGRRQMRVIEAI
ncbi:uncharacterized protein Dmoj_GI20201 [Drosophila mojavensis]|uniref:Ionotropic glutamate receptor C-terminal domain-containing protein n=1 Tax=Drosophila mojavensis TaxID=7230 RepID=B4KN50_DROMO|nr:uncharacterized protein Dmoj_GI20201 [Drosophila mojavensis]